MRTNQPYLLEYGTHDKIGDLDSIQGTRYIKIKNTGSMANKGTFWVLSDHVDSFQDPCLNLHKFNIFGSIWCISHQNKCQLLNFKFLDLWCPSRSIVAAYEQIWPSVENKKHGNFHNRGGSLPKHAPELTTIGAHIVSEFQPCTPNINELIAKSVLGNSFQDYLILRPLYTNLGQN